MSAPGSGVSPAEVAVPARRVAPAGAWWIAGGVLAALVALAPRYGWHRDELYFLQAGRHLAWGYVDQPPFTPLVARVADEVARHNLVVLRLLPAVATAATVLLAAWFVREIGGSRRAQVVGAAVAASSGFVLGSGHLLSTATFDLTVWMALLGLTARLLRTGDTRWWLAFGGIAGAGLWNKHLVLLLAAAVVVGLVVERRWELVTSRWLPAGGALALVIAAPNLWWQARNGWPQFEMAQALSERLATENRLTLLPLQVLFLGPLLVPLLWRGARWLYRNARRYRPLLWTWVAVLGATLATGGRPYYAFAPTLAVALAGVVAYERDRPRLRPLVGLVALSAAVAVPMALPILPPRVAAPLAAVNEPIAETLGWPELADQVTAVVADLPPAEQPGVVLLAATYGEAGALDRFGPARGLPPAYSPHNSYADFRRPADDGATVIAVRYPLEDLDEHFVRCDEVGTVTNDVGVDNEVSGTPITVCRGLVGTWSDLWSRLRRLS